ncbi:MAG: IS110 family transposase [Acidimicrobiia bacterium]
MLTIVGNPKAVVGGVDNHLEVHVAAAVDSVGGILGIETFEVSRAGYRGLLAWLRSFGELALVGVEGTGSYGAGLVRCLAGAGVAVVEVDRPNRQTRHRRGKSDPVDAVAAARAALSGQATGSPKSRDGAVEAIRVLGIARRSAVNGRIETLNQLRHLVFTASPEIRRRFMGLSVAALTREAVSLRPRPGDTVRSTTLLTIRTLGRRVSYLREETKALNRQLHPLIRRTAPGLLEVYGVGYDSAAKLLVAAGDNPERLRSEAAWAHLCGVAPLPASSGKTTRHRLNRGGNRQANSALYHVVLARMRHHEPTRDYVARRLGEGKTMGEVARILRRYVAREVYRHLPRPA